jgi:hypothetical protein
MRKRLVQVLERDDEDEPMDAVVRRFWSRTAPPSPAKKGEPAKSVQREHAKVVDLASARQARARGEPLRF